MSLMSDNINIIIFPVEFARKAYAQQWRGRTAFQPTEGRVVDHIGFSFEHLSDAHLLIEPIAGPSLAFIQTRREMMRRMIEHS